MADIKFSTELSEQNLSSIIEGVVQALSELLATKPALVDKETMAAILSISIPTLDRMQRAEKIPSIKIGSRRLYQPDSVIAAIEVTNETEGDRC